MDEGELGEAVMGDMIMRLAIFLWIEFGVKGVSTTTFL